MKFEISLFFRLFCVPDALKLSPYPLERTHQHVVLKQVDLSMFHKSLKIIVFKTNVVRQNNPRQCISKEFVCPNNRYRRRCRLKGIHSRSDTNRTGAEGYPFATPHCCTAWIRCWQ